MTNLRMICAGALVVGLSLNSTAAFAQGHGLSFIVKVAADPSIGGTSLGAASGSTGGSTVTLPSAGWTKTHSEKSPLFEGGVSTPIKPGVALVVFVNYGHAGANSSVLGQYGNTQLTARLDDYNYWGMEGGVHISHPDGRGFYAALTAGFRRVSAIDANLSAVALTRSVRIYDASVVPTVAFGGGIMWGDRTFGVGIEVAARYAGAPSSPTPLPTTPGETLAFASGAGARWSLPVGLVFRF